jgi:hypothetical protein
VKFKEASIEAHVPLGMLQGSTELSGTELKNDAFDMSLQDNGWLPQKGGFFTVLLALSGGQIVLYVRSAKKIPCQRCGLSLLDWMVASGEESAFPQGSR